MPVVKLAGGILICKMGWEMMSSKNTVNDNSTTLDPDQKDALNSRLFFPLTFPMTVGAGTISVIFTLSAQSNEKSIWEYVFHTSSILVAVVTLCVLIFFIYSNTDLLMKRLGQKNSNIVNRIMSFLIFCVGLQIASSGILALIK